MEVLVIDSDPAARAVLLGRLQELKRSKELNTIEPVPLLPKGIATKSFATVAAVILGPGLAKTSENVIQQLAEKTHAPIAALFHPAPSGTTSIVSDNDEGLKLFLVQSLAKSQLARVAEARKVIGIAHFSGGVGASTLALDIAKGIANSGTQTTLVDLDDVSGYLSFYTKAAPRFRAATGDALLKGTIDDASLIELLSPVSPNLTLVAQPESYAEAFHFKANVIESAPVASVMINSLLSSLRARDHAIVIDLARSWGLASFAALPRCGHIVFLISAENDRVKFSLECLRRLMRESDSTEEFDLSRWSLAITKCSPKQAPEIRKLISAANLFPESVPMHFISHPTSSEYSGELARLVQQLS